MVAAALTELARREADAWRPQPPVKTPEWCEAHLRLPSETSAHPGRYDLSRYPFWRGVLEAVDDPEVEQISIQAGTQVGKTTVLQAILASRPFVGPAPAILAAPDRDACRELRDKFYRLAEATPALADRLPPQWRRNDQWIDFGTMVCHLAWSGSRQRLSGKSCEYVLCTEVDRWRQSPREGATQRLIAERVKGFFHWLIVNEGAPTDETSAIAAFYESSDQRKFQVPCPHCGQHQELRFFPHKEGPYAGNGGVAGFQRPDGSYLTSDEAREAAYYICERGCRIESHEKTAMVARGVWCPRGQTVSENGALEGKPERSRRHSGFHLGSIYSDTIDFGRMAAAYLDSREERTALQSFWNNWLALRWTVKGRAPKWRRVGQRLAAGHRRGTVPQAAYFLTAGIDSGDDHAFWIVRAWGEGSTSWLVDWGKVLPSLDAEGHVMPKSDLDKLDALVLDREFPLVQPNPAGVARLRVRLANIDYQGHRTWEIFQWARLRQQRFGDRLRIIAGDTRVAAGEFYRLSIVEKTSDVKVYPGGLKRWAIDVDTYKEDLQARYEAALDMPGAWFLTRDIIAEDSDYLRQICNEGRRIVRNPAGREVARWEVIDHRLGNHYWDCEVYARCAADMVTGQEWSNLERNAAPPRPRRPQTQTADEAYLPGPDGLEAR